MPIFTGTSYQDDYNRPLYGVSGEYTLASSVEALPYFMCSMELNRAIDELSVSEQIPASLSNRWSLSELVQRELDHDRIKHDLVNGYIADEQKIVFFNALTVVLMPKENGVLSTAFSEPLASPPIPWRQDDADDGAWAAHGEERIDFGGVQYLPVGNQARLRWDRKLVEPLVVDGQHRLEGLRSFRRDFRGGTLKESEERTTIPVIFLLLSAKCGFVDPTNSRELRSVSRELFTDLNKNARVVDQARELVLDDFSIEPRCVRSLVTDEAAQDDPSHERIPLSLVRWQEENARFDSSYYINSIINLESLVSLVLGLKTPRDPMDKDEVFVFIQSVNDSIGLRSPGGSGRELRNERGKSLKGVYESQYIDEDNQAVAPFSRLPGSFLEAAVANFATLHRPWLLCLLTKHTPYAKVLEYARSRNLIEGVFGQFFAQTKGHQNLLLQQFTSQRESWYDDEIEVHRTAIEDIKGASGQGEWPFKAIFQRAMVRLGRSIAYEQASDEQLGSIDDLIAMLNGLYAQGVLNVGAELQGSRFHLWDIIARNPGGGKIKVTKRTEDRLLALLRLWYYQWRALEQSSGPSSSGPSAADLLKKFSTSSAQTEWPGCNEAVKELRSVLDSHTFFGSDPQDIPEASRKRQISAHLVLLLESARPAERTIEPDSEGSDE